VGSVTRSLSYSYEKSTSVATYNIKSDLLSTFTLIKPRRKFLSERKFMLQLTKVARTGMCEEDLKQCTYFKYIGSLILGVTKYIQHVTSQNGHARDPLSGKNLRPSVTT
jgi:hypothetical protein